MTNYSPNRSNRGGSGRPARKGGPSQRNNRRRPPSGPGRPRQAAPPSQANASASSRRDVHDRDGVRLQKVLAAAGVGSRRACEALISAGRVTVDEVVVTELGTRVDPNKSIIRVDTERISVDDSKVYLAFNKPLGVVSSMDDDLGRPCVGDYVRGRSERLFHVGRLDQDTEGLLLLTNDGELANRLQHPSYEVQKTYIATIPGPVSRDLGRTLREGIRLEDGWVQVDFFKVLDVLDGQALVELRVHEGRNRIVRRMLDAVGHPVISLARTSIGSVEIGQVRPGKMRPLNRKEVSALLEVTGL